MTSDPDDAPARTADSPRSAQIPAGDDGGREGSVEWQGT